MTAVSARPVRRLVTVLLLSIAALAAMAGPAAADPAGPTNYRTFITGIEPPAPGLDVEILGGDTYLYIDGGDREILLLGYDLEEQYLRWLGNGTVEVNSNSRSFYQNQTRYLTEPVPTTGVGKDVPPVWEVVSTNGQYAWHDHRVHFMTEGSLPPNVDPTLDEEQLAYAWPDPVVLEVDGKEVFVQGELRWYPEASPILPILGAVLALAGVLLVGRRKPELGVRVGTAAGVVLAGIVGLQENVGLEPGVQGVLLSLILPGVAAIAALAAFGARDRGDSALALSALAGVPLLVWAATHAAVLTAPVLPTGPDWFLRLVLGVVAGAAIGAMLLAARKLFSAPLIPDEDAVPA